MQNDRPDNRFARPTRTCDTIVFAPTYNERENIEALLDAIHASALQCDVLIVDDGSRDGTLEILATRASRDPRIGVIRRPGKLGIGSAHRLAWLHARRLGYSRLVTLDADMSHDPSDVPRLLAPLQGDRVDVVIGSRFAPGGGLDYRGWRLFLSRAANTSARLLLHLPLTEYTSSFRAARLDRVPPGLIETIDQNGYGFFLFSAAQLARRKLLIKEVPIHFSNRYGGKSKIPRLEVVRGIRTLLSLTIWRGPQHIPVLPEGRDSECPSCGQPYRIESRTGELCCLNCFDKQSRMLVRQSSGHEAEVSG